MSRSLRLALVSRRFWPLTGGAETVMSNLAAGLAAAGCEVRLLTARWEANWPHSARQRGFEVVRLPQPKLRFYGTWRYMRALRAWLRDQRESFDVVYVSMLKHDAYSAVGAGAQFGFPVALRAEGAGLTGDIHWQINDRFGRAIAQRCRQAQALVAPSAAILRELVAAGYPRERLHFIANGVSVPPTPVDDAQRAAARAQLAQADLRFQLPPGAKLALFTGRLHEGKGLLPLIDAWRPVTERWPEAVLWLVGEGPQGDELRAQVKALGLEANVALPGAFDDVEPVLAAADVFVLPSREEGMSVALLEAMAAGLPCVASDIPGNRPLIEAPREGWLVPLDDAQAWVDAVGQAWEAPDDARGRGLAARQRVIEEFSLELMVEEHLALFRRLAEGAGR